MISNVSTAIIMSEGDSNLNFICGGKLFPESRALIKERFKLFSSKPELLLPDVYIIQTKVSTDIFADFLRAFHGDEIKVTVDDLPLMHSLCDELGVDRSRFAISPVTVPDLEPALNSQLCDFESRLSRQEIKLEMAGRLIGNLQSRISRQESSSSAIASLDSRISLIESALSALQKSAKGEVLYRSGLEFLFGEHNIPRSTTLGLSLLKESADLGHSDSGFAYNSYHIKSNLQQENPRERLECIRLSSSSLNSNGLWVHGVMLQTGDLFDSNPTGAVDYFKASADLGNSEGQHQYGLCLRDGIGIAKDVKRAAQYFKLAADQENSGSQSAYGGALMDGEGIEKDVVLAASYFQKSADQGHPKGQVNYGSRLVDGQGVTVDLAGAARYYKMAADQGFALGQQLYALALQKGYHTFQPKVEAAKYLKMAADQGVKV